MTISKPNNTRRIILIAAVLAIVLSGCNFYPEDRIEEGVLEYEITYLENNMSNFATSLLPKTMYLKFNDHLSVNSIEGMMGMFFVKNIVDLKKQQSITLLKALNNEFFYEGEKKEQPVGFKEFDGLEVEPTNDTVIIAGFKCLKGLASIPGREIYPIYYTHQIGIKRPNALNPYQMVDGVLMQFRVELSNVKMEIKAKKFHNCEVPDEEFEIPTGFKKINDKEKMEQIIDELME